MQVINIDSDSEASIYVGGRAEAANPINTSKMHYTFLIATYVALYF